MALINCPHCGKQVSDTQEKCIHCGGELKESLDKQIDYKQYYTLPAAEQKALRAEFYKTDPTYAERDKAAAAMLKKVNVTSILRVVIGSITILFMIIARICSATMGKKFQDNSALLYTFVIIIVVGFIALMIAFALNLVFRSKFKKCRHNQLIIEKRYQKWLKEQKAIAYTVQFSAKQKKEKAYFDSINVDRTQMEV